jgi:hypothetical protein
MEQVNEPIQRRCALSFRFSFHMTGRATAINPLVCAIAHIGHYTLNAARNY